MYIDFHCKMLTLQIRLSNNLERHMDKKPWIHLSMDGS